MNPRRLRTSTPQAIAAALERYRRVPRGTASDRYAGYMVLALPFASGHVLAFRRVTATTMGPPYSSIWHRDPAGHWTFYSDVEPARACPRYFGRAVSRTLRDDIRVEWMDSHGLHIAARRARMNWALRIAATPATRLAAEVVRLSARHRSPRLGAALETAARRLLRVSHLPLRGTTPNGQAFQFIPRAVGRVAASAALIDGLDLGAACRAPQPLMLGEFRLPDAGLFVTGTGWFSDAAVFPCSFNGSGQGG